MLRHPYLRWLPIVAVVALVMLLPSIAFAADAPADSLLDQYQGSRLLLLYGVAFTAGLGASLTPCVYPMIPIVLGIFGARGKNVTRKRSLGLATLYVFGMGTTYAVLGTIFAVLGRNFSTVLAQPAVVIPICLLYVVLALSMFGAFELNLPAGLQNRLAKVGGNGAGGAFAMGLVGGFTAAPCTAPFATSLLTAVGKTGSIGIGASTMFIHALGIGVLYFVLAVFAGSLPRSGRWMEWVKSIGGIGLLVGAVYFVRPISATLRSVGSPELWFAAVGLGLAIAGFALGAVNLSFHDRLAIRLRKGFAVALVVVGSTMIIGWALAPKHKLQWEHDEVAAFARAAAEGKGVMVDFGADWCTPCAQLEVTFGDDAVFPELVKNFVPLKFDVTEDNALSAERKKRYDGGTPTVIFMSADRDVYERVREYLPPKEFRDVMLRAIGGLRAPPAAAAN